MTYNPAIPTANQLISASQQPIQDNFTQLNSQFGMDHDPFETGASNGTGFHKQVRYNSPLVADPTPSSSNSVLYTKSILGVGQLFFANSSGVVPITGLTTIAASGTTFLPGGIILKWGSGGTIGAPVAFSTPFPVSCASMTVTGSSTLYTGGFVVSPLTASTFTVNRTSGSGATGYYYIAVGF